MSSTPKDEQKFYQITQSERLDRLIDETELSVDDAKVLSGEAGLSAQDADHMIENVVGIFSLPLGIARNFKVNGRDVSVPMVVEEPSIVAGASFMAKLAARTGG
ncbi:MAG TPA: 3-hydroxy-3-methylglutaryl-CoA reductase, partial [Brevefilum sp.]